MPSVVARRRPWCRRQTHARGRAGRRRVSADSMAAPTAAPSPTTTASSEGPAPLSTQPSAPALRAAAATAGIHGKSARRYGWCRRSSRAVPHGVVASRRKAGEQQRHALHVEHRVRARHGLRQHRARLRRGARHFRNERHPRERRIHRQRHRRHALGAGARHGEAAHDGGGHVVGMPFRARREREQLLAREGRAEQRVAGDETAHPRRRARAEPARGRDAVHARQCAPFEGAARGLVRERDAAGHDVVGAGGQAPRALTFHAHATPRPPRPPSRRCRGRARGRGRRSRARGWPRSPARERGPRTTAAGAATPG